MLARRLDPRGRLLKRVIHQAPPRMMRAALLLWLGEAGGALYKNDDKLCRDYVELLNRSEFGE